MPRYYFDIENKHRLFDQVGADFENEAAARQEASLRVLNSADHQLAPFQDGTKLIIRNEAGSDIHAVPIAKALP